MLLKSSPLSTDPTKLRVVQGGAAAQGAKLRNSRKEGPASLTVTTALYGVVVATFLRKIISRTVVVPIVCKKESRTEKMHRKSYLMSKAHSSR